MSVNTRGFIATSFKNPFPVMELVEKALNQLIRVHWSRRMALQQRTQDQDTPPQFAHPTFRITTPGSGLVGVEFAYKGQVRTLHLNFLCDCDDEDVYDGPKIHLSIGDWGMSRPLLAMLLLPLSIFGPAWLDECDSDSIDHVPLWRDRKVNLMDLFAADLVHMSQVTVGYWYEYWKSTPQLHAMPLADFIGLSEEEVVQLEAASQDYDTGVRLMGELLEEYTASVSPLELDFSGIDACFPDWAPEPEDTLVA